jgi:CheY-like chemotaxis protein
MSLDRPIHVLHVEDDPNDVFLVKHGLGRVAPQARVSVVADGRQAQSYLAGEGVYADRSRHPMPDLVLMDLKLPRMSGLEVLEWMKTRPDLASLPVFILSSSTERTDVERAKLLGANGYHSKQGSLKASLETLDRILSSL